VVRRSCVAGGNRSPQRVKIGGLEMHVFRQSGELNALPFPSS
jgi:hypothetical protein